jgi:hypothetical protein
LEEEELVEVDSEDEVVCVRVVGLTLNELVAELDTEEIEGEAELIKLEVDKAALLLVRLCDVDLFEPLMRTKKVAAARISATIRTVTIARTTAVRLSSFNLHLFSLSLSLGFYLRFQMNKKGLRLRI